jgi:phospholipase C
MSGSIADVKHVVILMQENRSFDEYFGMFPGADGFYNTPELSFSKAWPGVLPFRMSTFSSQQGFTTGCVHDWTAQHTAFANGLLNGWSSAGDKVAVMGYYAADDIPYHWWLAQNFALCDNYHCSVLGPTSPNRMYMMTGTIVDSTLSPNDQLVFEGNPNSPDGTHFCPAPPWQTYADALPPGVTWKVYDYGSQPSPADNPGFTLGWDLNMLSYFSSWAQLKADPAHYTNDPSAFAADCLDPASFPTISWIFPQYGFTEHPAATSWDGAVFIAQILEALLAEGGPWDSTVLVVTYDENDGHFDHVVPQPPLISEHPEEFIQGSPIGPGFRVPAFVISPWTLNAGVVSELYDHTSIIRLLEDVTGVPCPNMPANSWRRQTFASLSTALDFTAAPAPAGSVPQRPDATALAEVAWARRQAAPALANPVPPGQTWPPVAQGCQLIMTTPSYSQWQVANQQGWTFPDGAVFVVVNGFEAAELLTTDSVGAPVVSLVCTSTGENCQTRAPTIIVTDQDGTLRNDIAAAVVSIDFAPADVSAASGVPSTFTFGCSLIFDDPDSTFAADPGTVQTVLVTAIFQADITVTSTATLELVTTDDPQFLHNFTDDAPYLSGELRVFQLAAGQSMFGVQLGSPGQDPAAGRQDALGFITSVMTKLTQGQGTVTGLPPGQIASFDDLNQDEEGSALALYSTADGVPVFNFALARVHMQAQPGNPATVRVFFRSFRASSTSVEYETQFAYRQFPIEGSGDQPAPPGDPEHRIPLLGVGSGQDAGEYVTIPFFATERISLSQPDVPMTWQYDPPNVQQLPATGEMVEAYFGCWLDINQDPSEPGSLLFPLNPPSDAGAIDGPFDAASRQAIQAAFLRDMHQCLVAEISYDPITIPPGDTPQYSAWLAQRNLGLLTAPNPGVPSSRQVLSTFDIRPTSPDVRSGVRPDELMISWGTLPAGSTASIYLPGADADSIMATAAAMYGCQPFTRLDDRTLECTAQGTTYMPVPALAGSSLCGLLTIALPNTIRKGEQFVVVVSQVTNAEAAVGDNHDRNDQHSRVSADFRRRSFLTWRTISGTFQLTVRVSTKQDILPQAESSLGLLRWILDSVPASDRWHRVLKRYAGALADQVDGLGGDAGDIQPSATGKLPATAGRGHRHGDHAGSLETGKIEALVFDHFGDFEGFILENGAGERRTFHSRERNVEEVARRAWQEGIRTSVVCAPRGRDTAVERIILHGPGGG